MVRKGGGLKKTVKARCRRWFEGKTHRKVRERRCVAIRRNACEACVKNLSSDRGSKKVFVEGKWGRVEQGTTFAEG